MSKNPPTCGKPRGPPQQPQIQYQLHHARSGPSLQKGLGEKTLSLPSLFPSSGKGNAYPAGTEIGRNPAMKRSPSDLLLERRDFVAAQGRDHKLQIESFLDLAQYSNHATSIVPVDQPLFKVTPPVVCFCDFEGLQVYEAVVTFRNQDSVSRRVKVYPPDSPFFELAPGRGRGRRHCNGSSSAAPGDKVPPGMEVSYIVRFKPDARIDYSYDLAVITERERFSVPIRACGGSALLDFPDSIDFGDDCIVGDTCERTVFMRNVGDRACKFAIYTTPPFSVAQPEGILAQGQACQVGVCFTPELAQVYQSELHLKYGDLEATAVVRGAAVNAEVSLSQSHLVIDDTYVGLDNKGVVTIRNDSEVPIDFCWHLFPSIDAETAHRATLLEYLEREESDEALYMQQAQVSEESSEGSDSDGERRRVRKEAKISSGLQRKYGNISKAIHEDPMLFRDPIFSIEPLRGRVWSNSQMTCTCTFSPKDALVYSCSAYLSCVGQEERAPLMLKALGIGPKATFSYDELDVGNVFLESDHRYEVLLLNQGDIEVDFRLSPQDTTFGRCFEFRPTQGTIAVGSQCEIVVEFKPSELGTFHEVFEWHLRGSNTAVTLAFRGASIQPTFTFDTHIINFGNVSFGFLNSRMLTLTNDSQVPCVYRLQIPGDAEMPDNEFSIIPTKGTLLPLCSQRVQVDFIAAHEKKYDARLTVDLEGVGEVLTIPIHAQCSVPTVSFEPHGTLNYGDVFIRYPFHQSLYLHNTSQLPAKFEVLAQEDKSRGEIEPDQWTGTVPPFASHVITVTLTAYSAGQLRIPMYVKIVGRSVPFPLVLTANSVGPRVEVDPPMLDWGSVKCLEDVTRHIRLTNNSCIDASIRAFMNERKSLWTVHPKIMHLSPQETLQLAITLRIDETCTMQDTLNLVIQEGEDLSVQVKGRGIESPVRCEPPDLEFIDFGTIFTTRTETRDIVIKNYGQAARRINWVREKEKDKKKEKKEDVEPARKGKNKSPQPPAFAFRVEPEFVVLEPRTAYRFTVMAMSPVAGEVEEVLLCNEALEKGGGVGKTIFKPRVKANFVAPLLNLSSNSLDFQFLWAKDRPIAPLTEMLTLTNAGLLDIRYKVDLQYPFSVDYDEGLLVSGGSQKILVDFDPGFKSDKKSCAIKQKLTIQYEEHPATNVVDLIGKVVWPNLELETTKIDFGTILNETTKTIEVKLTNPTAVPVAYQWYFQGLGGGGVAGELGQNPRTPSGFGRTFGNYTAPGALSDGDNAGDSRYSRFGHTNQPLSAQQGSSTDHIQAGSDAVDISQIFDILPIYGQLAPGESQVAQFTYYGMRDRSFRTGAICQVDGGPDYLVELKGNAAPCKYMIDRSELNFGDIPFTEISEQELYLQNPGKVPVTFNFNASGISRQVLIDINPASGVLKPDEKHKINVKFRAGIPDHVLEVILVEVEYYEPKQLTIKARGTFPGIILGLPRSDPAAHAIALQAAAERMQAGIMEGLNAGTGGFSNVPSINVAPADRRKMGVTGDLGKSALVTARTENGADPAGELLSPTAVPGGVAAAFPDEATSPALGSTHPASKRPPGISSASSLPDGFAHANKLALELEVDRFFLCEALMKNSTHINPSTSCSTLGGTMRAGLNPTLGSPTKSRGKKKDSPDSLDVVGAYYDCDFGYIALGQNRPKKIEIHNCCAELVAINLDKKILLEKGFQISPESMKPLPSGKSAVLTVTAVRGKDEPEGVQELYWDLPVRGGPIYKVHLKADFVLPDVVMSHDSVDFGRVLVGQKKSFTIEFRNDKMVPVDWAFPDPRDRFGRVLGPNEVTFSVSPSSGNLMPGDRRYVVISFAPKAAQAYTGSLSLKMKDNQQRKTLHVAGRGDSLALEVRPGSHFELGPVRPSVGGVSQEFFLYNPTDYAIEVYAVDFDKTYLEEEQVLYEYPPLQSGYAELPVRYVGDGTWREVTTTVAAARRERAKAEQEAKLAEEGEEGSSATGTVEEAEKEGVEEDDGGAAACEALCKVSPDEVDTLPGLVASDYPWRVPQKDRVNALLVGPPKVGVSTMARKLSAEDQRKVLTLDEAVEWVAMWPRCLHSDRNAKRICDAVHSGEELTPADVAHALIRRKELPDCNAGVIIDGLQTKFFDYASAFDVVLQAFKQEMLQVLLVTIPDVPAPTPRMVSESGSVNGDAPPPPPPSAAGLLLGNHYKALQTSLLDFQTTLTEQQVQLQTELDAATEALSVAEATLAAAKEAASQPQQPQNPPVSPTEALPVGPTPSLPPSAVADSASASATADKEEDEGSAVVSDTVIDPVAAAEAQLSKAQKSVADLRTSLSRVQTELECCKASIGWAPPVPPGLEPPPEDPKAKAKAKSAPKAKAKAAAAPPEPEAPTRDAGVELIVENYLDQHHALTKTIQEYVAAATKAERDRLFELEKRKRVRRAQQQAKPRGAVSPTSKGSGKGINVEELMADFEPNMSDYQALVASINLPFAESPFTEVLEQFGEAAREVIPLPKIPSEAPLPKPTTVQIVTPPRERPPPSKPANFSLLTPLPAPKRSSITDSLGGTGAAPGAPGGKLLAPPGPEPNTRSSSKKSAAKADQEAAAKAEEEAKAAALLEAEGAKEETTSEQTRWMIEPKASQRLLLHFDADEVSVFSSVIQFEIVGDVLGGPVPITVAGTATLPGLCGDPRIVFPRRKKKRPQEGYAIKSFVTALNIYDFGPLLAGRSPSTRACLDDANATVLPSESPEEEGTNPDNVKDQIAQKSFVMRHSETLKLLNTSLFPANITLKLQSEITAAEHPEPPPAPTGKAAKGAPAVVVPEVPKSPFFLEPTSLHLDVGQQGEVQVWCFPQEKGVFEDQVVATVEHNSEPVIFPLCAVGELPAATVDVGVIDFGRLMLNIRANEQLVKIKNPSMLPVRWQLQFQDVSVTDPDGGPVEDPDRGTTIIPREFSVEPMEGLLAAGEDRDVRVGFRSARAVNTGFSAILQVRDAEGLRDWNDSGNFAVKAEAFAVEAVVEPDPHQHALDFGTVLVNSSTTRTFEILNTGRFAVRYQLAVRRALRDFISVDSPSGEIEKGARKTITVTCTPTKVVDLPPERDGLVLQVFDTLSGAAVEHSIPPIRVGVVAVYNTFQVTPPRGVNFGPVQKGEKQNRSFTLRNVGIFPFDWAMFDATDPPELADDGRPTVAAATAHAGPFVLSKASGKLGPDEEEIVEVTFTATGDCDFESKIAVWVDGLQGEDTGSGPGNSIYYLTGQSVVPGINTTDLHSIFEEQFISRSFESAVAIVGRQDVRVFCEADRIFHFGPVLAHGGGGPRAGGGASVPTSPTAAMMDMGNGVTEQLRLSNPKAIPVEVHLFVKARDGSTDCPFTVTPAKLIIQPHDSEQIQVTFKPTLLKSFSASLEITVPTGSDPNTNHLEFGLKGDGAVPSVSIQGFRLFGDDGGELNLGKLAVGRSHEVKMALRNDGLLPATVRLEVKKPSVHFTLASRPSVVVGRGEQKAFQVRFHPRSVGNWEADLGIRTLGNEAFEDVNIHLLGEGYSDEVSWDLSEAKRPLAAAAARTDEEPSSNPEPPTPDDLQLGEVALGNELRVNFQLVNNGSKPLRYCFPEEFPAPFQNGVLKIEPLLGFVAPNSQQNLTAIFRPTELLEAEKIPINAAIETVTLADDQVLLSPAGPSSPDHGSIDPKSVSFEAVEGSERQLPLYFSAKADAATLETDATEICFAPTVMFNSKVHRFTIKNPSKISAPFEWRVSGKNASAFTTTPLSGSVPPEGEREIEITFAPLEVEDFGCNLLCFQPGSNAVEPALKLLLGGSALRPWCHIELVEGDYRNRRQAETPLDPKYRVVEVVSLGTRVKSTKRFYVYNPTAEPIDFMWLPQTSSTPAEDEEDTFRCLSKRGTILPGKKFEMAFEFAPQTMETKECFWNFCLPTQKVVEHFLVAGFVEEPRVGMDLPSLHFGERLLDSSATETVRLVNKEHIPFQFTIDPYSYRIEGVPEAVYVQPTTGVVGPDTAVDLEVTFRPQQERNFNFNIICNVKRKKEPVVLNVKGSGYAVHAALSVDEPAGRRNIYAGTMEQLDFGMMQVQEHRTVNMFLSNQSKKNFSFQVQVVQGNRPPRPLVDFDRPPYLAVSQARGDVKAHEDIMLELTYTPHDVHTLEGTILQVVVPAGPREVLFQLALSGGAKRSRVDLSFLNYDFGPCFVAKDGATMAGVPLESDEDHRYERIDLIATNRDDTDCLISTPFTREPWLDVQLNSAMIEAGGSLKIPIVFSPREVCEYAQRLEFVVNDYTKIYVDIRGRGCPLRLELTNLEMQHVDFGVVTGGATVRKTVKLINRSARPVTFQLCDEEEELAKRAISWSPSHPTTLRARETCDVEVVFSPTTRVAPFKAPLMAKCQGGLDLKILTVEGTCHATEMRLSEHSSFFGEVVVGSQATRSVRLHNFGDLGARFKFEMPARYQKLFSITPSEGFVRPGEELPLIVAFHPSRERIAEHKKAERANALRRGKPLPPELPGPLNVRITVKDIRCVMDGLAPLILEVSGVCVERTGETKTLSFSTEVRKEVKQSFEIENTQDTDWKLKPQVVTIEPADVSFFSCPREIVVPAKKRAEVEVTYLPFTMTDSKDGNTPLSPSGKPRSEKHHGQVFVGTPDGNAIIYTLEGVASPPKIDRRIQEKVPCKKQHNQRVPVKNWLHERQRFHVKVELVDPDPSHPDAQGIKVDGVSTLDLPPGLERDYRFTIYSYHETQALVRVSLTSQETGEFIVVEVELDFYAPESLATINLEAACRQVARHKIAVANPLGKLAKFKGTSSHPAIRFANDLEVPAKSERTVDILFRPIEEGEGEAEVSLKSDELGIYPYSVHWKAAPAGLERSLTLKAPLGGSSADYFKFQHIAKVPVEYKASIVPAPGQKTVPGDFILEEASVNAPACDEQTHYKDLQVRIRFQPSALGTKEQPSVSAVLVVTGKGGGEFRGMITGFAQPPQPQGPFEIQNGKAAAIEFRNPFDKPTEFTLQVDNPCFVIPMRSQTIEPQKPVSIGVSFKSDQKQGGRLIISCKQVSTPWIFYLKGEH